MSKSSSASKSHTKAKAAKSSSRRAKTTKRLAAELTPPEELVLPELSSNATAQTAKPALGRLPAAWEIARTAGLLLWEYRKLLLGILAVYAVLNLILVQGLANGVNVNTLKSQVAQSYGGHASQLASGLTVFAYMVGSAGGTLNSGGGAYALFLIIIASLAFIWALKRVVNGATFPIRDAYYQGMYPLVPVMVVLVVVGLQMLPLLLGATLYNLLVNNSIVEGPVEIGIVALVFLAAACVTLYMVSSSLLALYVATTPDTTPRAALQTAAELVQGRRWVVLRKILFLPLLLMVAGAIIMVPFIIFMTSIAPWVFFVLTVIAVAAVHGYMYTLYRELAHETAQ